MADEGIVKSYDAGEALVQGRAVTYNTSDEDLEYADADTEDVFGFTTKDAASGEPAAAQVSGYFENALADGSGTEIHPGMSLMIDDSSDGVLVAHDGTTGNKYVAKAVTGTSSATGRIHIIIGSFNVADA